MGQSLSRRRPASTPIPATPSTAATEPGQPNETHLPRRSLHRRILSSIPKPSLRSRRLSSSLTLPTRPEQTLRGKNRRWRLSRRQNIISSTDAVIPEHTGRLTEHSERQVDRDVDEFGVITHRVPDNHNDSPAASAKGKEKAEDASDIEVDSGDDDQPPIPSTSIVPPLAQSGTDRDPVGDDEVVVVPTVASPSRQPSPSLPAQQPGRLSVPLQSELAPPSPPQLPTQQANTNPRPFPPPGTLVVVQGVVHTTDVPRSSDRPSATPNPILPQANDPLNPSTNTDPSSARPSSVPPESRPRNPFSGLLPRPTSMSPTVPFPEPAIGSSGIDLQAGQTTSNTSAPADDSEDEDRTRTYPHGISMAQGPVGASGLSASSIDVLGTLLSVAAAATAASLLTGSSEPIFSSGLTSSQPPPPSNFISPPAGFGSSIPSERPLSPTPTSDAGRMRHVWSSLRDRLGLGGGIHNTNHSANTTNSSLGPSQIAPPQPSEVTRPRDPREIMLAEMARAFNLGLGLGGATASPTNSNADELAMPVGGDVDRNAEQSSFPPPDSFERFLMDLQTDLRVTLMQEQEPGPTGGAPRDADETAEDVEEDQPIPELLSLSDSDSEEFGTRHLDSDDEDQLGCDDLDEGDEGDIHTAQEQLSGRTSPAVSAIGTTTQYPFGTVTSPGTSSGASSIPLSTTLSQPIPTTSPSPGADGDNSTSNGESGDVGVTHTSSSISIRTGARIPYNHPSSSQIVSEEGRASQSEGTALGVAHSREASNGGQRVGAEGCGAISRSIAVPPPAVQDPSNVSGTGICQESFLPGTSSSSVPATSNAPNSFPAGLVSTSQLPAQLPTSTLLPSSEPEPTSRTPSPTNPTSEDSPMPFRLPFTPSSASRTEHTPGGGLNWWRMYRFPAITSPNSGPGGSQGSPTLSQPPFRNSAQGPNHSSSSWARTTNTNETITSRAVAQVPSVHSGPAQSAPAPPAAAPTNMPEIVPISDQSASPISTIGVDSVPFTNTNTHPPEHRGNGDVVVPVIVVGLQSVNVDRHPPHMPNPHANRTPAVDDENGDGLEFDGLEPPMSMPLHVPEPAEFRHHLGPSNTTQQEYHSQQPPRGRTWQSRAANAIRNLRPSRRNADTTSPLPQEAPGSRTFLIYVIGGYYPPDHQIITGGNLDSFEALWELAELLGQVKPPTVSKEEIDKSGLEVIKASMLEQYEKKGRVASNCIDRCLICLDDYNQEDDLRVLACKHTFHQGCVDRWLETGRNNCPACRTKGVSNENAGPTPMASDAIV